MPTRNRRRYIPRAVKSFLLQTHEPRELIVLDDGDPIDDLLPRDPRIRYGRYAGCSLGEKRNAACELSRGELVAHWDDDDWSHPNRLKAQVSDRPVVGGFQRMLFWDEVAGSAYEYGGDSAYAVGTSLIYRRDWWSAHRFEPMDRCEDNLFCSAAAGVLRLQDGLGMMVATSRRGDGPLRAIGMRQVDASAIPPGFWA